jgi:hypothetical protein
MITESLNIPKTVVLQILKEDFCSRDILLHDNAPIFDPQKRYNPLSPSNSPDLSLPAYFLFHKLTMKLEGLHFVDVAQIQEAVTEEIKKVQKQEFIGSFS